MLPVKRAQRLCSGPYLVGFTFLLALWMPEKCDGFAQRTERWELSVQLVAVGVTNMFMALPIYAAWKAVDVVDVVTGIFVLAASTTYHSLQAVDLHRGDNRVTFLGGNSDEWHKADNVFSFACVAALFLQPLQITTPALLVGIQALILCLAATSQTLDPWSIWGWSCTPIAVGCFCLTIGALVRLWQRRMPILRSKWYILGFLLSIPVAAAFFVVGLDDEADYLRIKHGMWHVMISLAGFCVVRAFNPNVVIAKRRALMLGSSVSKSVRFIFLDAVNPKPKVQDADFSHEIEDPEVACVKNTNLSPSMWNCS